MSTFAPKSPRRSSFAFLALLLGFFMLLLASPATAQPMSADQKAGRDLAREALKLFKADKYDEALNKFEEASKLYPTGQVLRMTGFTYLELKRWIEGANAIERALESEVGKPLSKRHIEEAKERLAEAKKHFATIIVKSNVDNAKASVDDGEEQDVPATFQLEPGTHTFVVTADERLPARQEEDLEGGQESSLTLDPKVKPKPKEKPKPTPKPEPKDEGTPGWFPHQTAVGMAAIGLGVVASGVALGAGVYGITLNDAVQENIDIHAANYDPSCSANSALCRHDIALINQDGQRAQTYRNVGLITGIVGGGLVLVGTTFWLFAADGPLGGGDAKKTDDDNIDKDKGDEDKTSFRCGPDLTTAADSAIDGVGIGCFGSFF